MLPVPPPVLSRVFQELSNGMLFRNNALKIATTPFPFPYAQMSALLLLTHWIITPLVMCLWTNHYVWTFLFTFIPVLSLWCIQFIAAEIEHPFGNDINDLPVQDLQKELNVTLLMLIDPVAQIQPGLSEHAE